MAIGGAAAFIGAFISTVVQGFSSGAPDNIGEWAIPAATSAAAGAVGGALAGPALGGATGTATGAAPGAASGLGTSVGSSVGAAASAMPVDALLSTGSLSSFLGNVATPTFTSTALPAATSAIGPTVGGALASGGTDSFWSANAGQLLNSGVKLAGSIAPMFASQPEIQPVNAVAPPLLPPVREQTRDAEKSPEKLAEADYRRKTNDRAYAQQKQADELANIETMLNYQRALEKTGKGKLLTPTTASQRFSGTPPSQGGYI